MPRLVDRFGTIKKSAPTMTPEAKAEWAARFKAKPLADLLCGDHPHIGAHVHSRFSGIAFRINPKNGQWLDSGREAYSL